MATPKTRYSATFADGLTITRESHRAYTHAWRTPHGTGFSRGLANAQSSARALNTVYRPRDGRRKLVGPIDPIEVVVVSIVPRRTA